MNPLYVLGLGLAFFLTCKGEEAATCDPDIRIAGGWVTKSKGNEPKSVAKFECPDSQYPWPVSSSKCQNGKWSHTQRRGPLVCKEFQCPAPVLEEGIVTPVNLLYAIGETVSFECYDGYALKGSESRTCTKNGRWNGTNTICTTGLQDCPHPGVPPGGRKAGTSYSIGDTVRYYCNDGLVLVGSSSRRCLESGEWSGAAPACQHRYSFDMVEDVAESFTASLTSTMGRSRTGDSKTPTSLARKIKVSKDSDLHMYFMIDASDSVGEENFNQAIMVVKNLIDKIASFDISPRFGVVTYASKPLRVINLNEEERSVADAVVDILENEELAKYDAHLDQRGTNIFAALEDVYKMMTFSKQAFQGTWKRIRFVTILFTDGKSNMGPNPRIAADRIQNFVKQQNKTEDYLDMYAFGISEEVDTEELNNLASKKNDEKHSFTIRNTSQLVDAFDKILDLNTLGDLCGVADERPNAKSREKQPWHVYINIPKALAYGGTLETGSCSGSIVAPNWILTAAHCFTQVDSREKYQEITVTLGENKIFRVKELFIHPEFMLTAKADMNISQFYDYDVALIELEKKVEYSTTIRSICLPCTPETTQALRHPHPRTRCSDHERLLLPTANPVQAFFVKQKTDKKEEKQGYVTIKTGEGVRRACEEKALKAREYQQVENVADVVTDRFLCTGGSDPIQESITCQGESGGSLFIHKKRRFIQAGVVSWGVVNVCKDRRPDWANARDFHINLFRVLPWLKETLTSVEFID